MLVNTVR